jgi:hypothetical protein
VVVDRIGGAVEHSLVNRRERKAGVNLADQRVNSLAVSQVSCFPQGGW